MFFLYDLDLSYLSVLIFFFFGGILQLAILASYSGDELTVVYRYFRSLAVDTPCTTARDNLIVLFEKVFSSLTR